MHVFLLLCIFTFMYRVRFVFSQIFIDVLRFLNISQHHTQIFAPRSSHPDLQTRRPLSIWTSRPKKSWLNSRKAIRGMTSPLDWTEEKWKEARDSRETNGLAHRSNDKISNKQCKHIEKKWIISTRRVCTHVFKYSYRGISDPAISIGNEIQTLGIRTLSQYVGKEY